MGFAGHSASISSLKFWCFGIKIMYSDNDNIIEDIDKIGVGFVSSFIFDSQSQNQFRAHGDISFLDFILYFHYFTLIRIRCNIYFNWFRFKS